MLEAIKSVKFKYRCNPDIGGLFNDFREMIMLCIDRALELNITSYARLRKAIYDEWKRMWYPKYHTHYCHSACRIATVILKNFRKRKRKGLVKKEKPEVRKDFLKLEEMLFKFERDKIRIVTSPRRYIVLELVVGDYQKEFIDAWREGKLDIGEIIIKRDYVIVPFKRKIKPKDIDTIMTIDINEKNVTYSIFDLSGNVLKTVRLDIYKAKRIHDNYSKKREKIQKKLAKKPLKMRKILQKYSGREKRRIEDYLHKVSAIVVSQAKKYNSKIVMENLKNIRESINKKNKKIRRRLNRWNFRKLQFFIEYKAIWSGLAVEYVNPRRTSSLCPICGHKLKKSPNGQRLLKCKKCGLEFDRDVIATYNLYKKSQNVGSIRSPRTLPDEVLLIREDGTGEPLHPLLKTHKKS